MNEQFFGELLIPLNNIPHFIYVVSVVVLLLNDNGFTTIQLILL